MTWIAGGADRLVSPSQRLGLRDIELELSYLPAIKTQ